MGKSIDARTLYRIITEQIRAGNMHVIAGLIRKLIEEAGYEEGMRGWGLERHIADAGELVELEKHPRRAAPALAMRSHRIEELELTYPFLAGWGACCANGWLGLLEQTCLHITAIATRTECVTMRTIQLREKFGTLRWYLEGGSNRVPSIARAAELLSATLCAACGSAGTIRNRDGWYITLCDTCATLTYPELSLAISEDLGR